MQYLMKHVERVARANGAWIKNPHVWTAGETLKVYEAVVNKFKYQTSGQSSRNCFNEFSWRTIVNLVRNYKGKLVGEP